MALKEKTLSGVSWTATARVVQQLIRFGVIVLLTRLLTPEAFGLIGMIIVITGFVELFSDAGFGAALIQKKNIEERHLSSIFWINVLIGTFLTLIVGASASLVADFYGEPALVNLTRFIALQFFIGSLNTVQQSLLQRKMNFKKLTIVQISTQVISGGIAVGMALTGFGVWSLAWQSLITVGSNSVLLWVLSPWRPKWIYDGKAVKDLLKFSSNLLGFKIINYWSRSADDLLIGRFVGSAGLGIYTRAYSTMLLPISQVTNVLQQVMFPALSKIQDDIQRVKRIYLQANRIIALISMPMMCGLFVVAEPFVISVFGSQWEEVVPVLQILCFVGIKQPMGSTSGWIFQSQNKTDVQFKWNIVVSIVTILAFVIGLKWGVIGVAAAYAIRSYIVWYPAITIVGNIIDMTFTEFITNVAGVFFYSITMAVIVYGVGLVIPSTWTLFSVLVIQVLTGIITYLGLIHFGRLKAYKEAKRLLFESIENLKDDKS
ncbi:MOP flippase family protein [Fodinibius saliphilus]|uniref:MOP flippase family protein n=1 Tax=Fodinibius saliphilus TaxID=1920650 RepID=UPI001107CF9B|nr:MOP flippase family protein [Fodinibius saliphilus]